ncbi:chain-length determining protein [Roseivivax marinus]|uniref:chain-length determining protein n=1 Tax=Roseivivax marinus TaxID=1379903 RepID=UPI00273F4449|nr:chain-length determining protein [Roseivivax marinus]
MTAFQSSDEVFAALRRRAFLIVLLTALGCAASVWVALQQDKLYEATAVVQIEDARIPDRMTGQAAPEVDPGRRVRLIEQRLMARDNLLSLMEEYGLFPDEDSMNERIFALRQAVSLEEIRGNAQPWQTDIAPSGLRITVRLDDPSDAAAVANDLMASVIAEAETRSAARARETVAFFASEADRVASEIAEAESAIAAFKTENSEALPEGTVALRDQLSTLQENLLALDREIIAMQNNSSRLRQDELTRQVALLREQRTLVDERITRLEANLARAPEVERALGALERDLSQLQERYGVVNRRRADAEMAQVLQDQEAADRFEVLETALEPETAISRSKRKVAAAGGVVSLFLAVGIAVLIELLNPAIRTAGQLERQLGVSPVVAIPVIRTRRDRGRRGLLWLGGLAVAIAAAWLALRTFGGAIVDSGVLSRLPFPRGGS